MLTCLYILSPLDSVFSLVLDIGTVSAVVLSCRSASLFGGGLDQVLSLLAVTSPRADAHVATPHAPKGDVLAGRRWSWARSLTLVTGAPSGARSLNTMTPHLEATQVSVELMELQTASPDCCIIEQLVEISREDDELRRVCVHYGGWFTLAHWSYRRR
jgi:hypothetical protein